MKRRKKVKSELKRGYSLMNITLLVISFTIFGYLQFYFMDDIFLETSKLMMISTADEIASLDFESDTFKSELSDIESNNSVYVEIYSPRDELIYTTNSNETVYDTNNKDPSATAELKPRVMKIISQEIKEDGSYFEIRQEFFATAQFLVYGNFYPNNTGIEIYYATDLIKDNANIANWILLVLTSTILFVVIGVILFVAKFYIDPIQRIKTTTKKMATLDFSEVCPRFRNKELDELSDNINFLSSSLSKSMKELENENRKLESDIEKERKQEKARRSFVANASHELKTPISIIQGYAEGMKYGIGCDSTEEFCDIIIEEAKKMNSLIARLMEQLKYSSASYELNESAFNIHELITELIDSRRLDYKECGIDLSVEIPEDLTGLGDRDLLSSVFNNYYSNALSHIDFEKELKITIKDVGSAYRLSVYNSGKPVSGTDIENIWQSFYRADKSHSRNEGRFGLGLSIVSTIQELHKQKYGVINRYKGVEFWFDIKKA